MTFGGCWLAERARVTPEAIALEDQGERISYEALAMRAGAIAAELDTRGLVPGDILALLVDDRRIMAEWVHGAFWRGLVLLPLHLRLTRDELAFQLRDAGARALVHDGGARQAVVDQLTRRLREARIALPSFEAPRIGVTHPTMEAAPAAPARPGAHETPLAILYTSGTSGRPKGAVLTRGNFESSAVASAFQLGIHPEDRWLVCMPLYHIGGLSILIRSCLYGTTAVLEAGFDTARVNARLDRGDIHMVSLVPTMLLRLLDARNDAPFSSSLRCVLLGGAATPRSLLERARRAGVPVAPTYGLTEATSQVATRAPHLMAKAPPFPMEPANEPVGGLRPLLGTRIRILDDAGRECGVGETGEIVVSGPTVMARYWKRSAQTAATLRDGWLRTGDLGRLDASGGLTVIDRRSDLIVSGAENVYPAEVEAALGAHPDVAEVGVRGVEDADFGHRPAAWVVLHQGATSDADTLASFCREHLAGYKVPVRFHLCDQLPRTASGKLLRRKLGTD